MYLGRTKPLLHSSIDYLAKRWPAKRTPRGHDWDLSHLLIVLPSARSGRRLQVLLGERAMVVKPKVITVGELSQYLCKPTFTVATEVEQTLAWARVLVETPEEELTALLSTLPPREPMTPWIELAGTIRELHQDLAAGELTFAHVENEVMGEAEQRRWRLLNVLHGKYLQRLQEANRIDPFVAGNDALRLKQCRCDYDVVLIGTSDLSRSITSMLRAIVEAKGECGTVTALVAAEETDRDHFDPFGSIIATQWIKRHPPLRDEQIVPAQDVADQAATAANFVEHWQRESDIGASDASLTADQITVGVTDESLVGPVEFELRTRQIASHRELGWTIGQTPVGRLLELLAEHLSRNSWRSLAALVRHADVHEFIQRSERVKHDLFTPSNWLTALDQLTSNHYPTRCDDELPAKAIAEHAQAVEIRELIQATLRELRGPSRTLSDWAGKVSAWLTVIYGEHWEQMHASSQRITHALSSVIRFLQTIQEVEGSLDVKISASSAIEMLMSRLMEMRVLDAPSQKEVTIAGWLDLALDDAPAMVITSLNHPYVPESVTADPFLPGSLRTRLQLNDNDRRMARDIHSLDVILSCRKHVKLIVGARSIDGSPTPPSRLLAASEPSEAARRLVYLLEPSHQVAVKADTTQGTTTSRGEALSWAGPLKKSNLPIPTLPLPKAKTTAKHEPQPAIETPVKAMSVTAFKDYLDCPYRFYLRHVLRIKPLDDASGELEANQFGDLIHNTLEAYGKSDRKDLSEPDTIKRALHETLDHYVDDFFGRSTNAAVRLQIEQARRRLSAVANAQSERIKAGWRIHKVEAPFGEDQRAGIRVDDVLMTIRGRIDRIDRHDDGRWAIIDYKSHGHPPRKKHLKGKGDDSQWIDLQLPLYQLLIPFVIGEGVETSSVSLSYFNVGDNAEQTKINDADFTKEEFARARQLIEECVRRIRRCDFTPSDDVTFDDYSMILQTGAIATLFERLVGGDAEAGTFAEAEQA